MANDDEVHDETFLDPTFAPKGPRRSTFTPPTEGGPAEPADALGRDDELADALAAELPADLTPPWTSLPAPDATPGPPVTMPEERQAADHVVDNSPSATLDAIEQLELQIKQREEEARIQQEWDVAPPAPVSPDPAPAQPGFADMPAPSVMPPEAAPAPPPAVGDWPQEPPIPTGPETGSFLLPEAPVADWPSPSFGEPDVEVQPISQDPAPAQDLPGGDLPAAFPPPVFPPADQAPPAADIPPPVDIPPVVDVPPVAETPPPPPPSLPAWDVPAPSATWSPGPDYEAQAPQEPAPQEPAPQEPAAPEPTAEPFAGLIAEPLSEPISEPVAWPQQEFLPPPPPPSPNVIREAVIETEGVEVEQLAPPPPPSNVIREAVIEDDAVEVEPLHFEPRGGRSFSPPPLVEPLAPPPVLPSDVTGLPSESIPIVTPGIADAAPPVPPKFDFAAPTAPAVPLPPPPTAGRPFSFDDLVAGTDEEPPLHTDAEPATEAESTPEALFIEPLPVAAGESVPMDTGSVAIINQPYEEELPDDVDETDLAIPGLIPPITSDIPGSAALVAPSGPIATVRIPDDEVVLLDGEPMRQRALAVEEAGVEPTPVEYRIGQSARLFWLWFAANSSILSLGLGAAVFAVGMSLRQSVIAIVAGVALAFIPLGLTTLAGKRSGQPTMIVSRATFGLVGNVFPAILALLVRLFWGAVLLWLLASSVGIVLVGAQLNGPLGERQLLLVALAAAFVISLLVAFAGYTLISRIQLVLSIISGLLVVGLIAMTAGYVDVPKAISTPDGSWILAITGAVLVFSFVGLVWAHSGADLARYQRESSGAASSMFWASFGTALPSFLLIGYGALLAASNDKLASGFVQSPLDTLASLLPIWYPVPLIAAAVLSLLSGVTLSIYSGGFALQSIGLRVRRPWSIVIVGLLLGGVALLLTFGVSGGINELFRDVATTLAVPTAAWVGIFAADTMMRKSHYDSDSLLTPGGVYPAVRWVNLLAFFIITAIGFALTTATVTWLSWQGYGFTLLGVPANSELAGTDLGVLVALLLGILISIIAGARSVRRQEGPRP